MTHMLHELSEDFPQYIERMQLLRVADPHFAELYNEYHEVNQAVIKAERDEEPTSDDHLNALRHRRVQLKDDIYVLLTKD